MQTEQMTRLLKKDKTSPSEYRISGFLLTIAFKTGSGVYYCKELKPYKTIGDLFDNWVLIEWAREFDSFEPGMKVDGSWWFPGDRIVYKDSPRREAWVLTYKDYIWQIKDKTGHYMTSLNNFTDWKRIGNIHEGK